ncbi:MAG: Mpo1-like protein [Bacteroidota bacterium]
MKTTEQWLSEYGESHRNHTNKLIHWLCVPAIMFSLIGLLSSIPSESLASLFPVQLAPFANWGTVFLVFALLFYLRLSFVMFLGMLIIATLFVWGNYQLRQFSPLSLWATSLIIFAVAWIGQFIGHKIEGKKPSFFKDLQFLLIGPAWLLSFIYQKLGIRY